MAEKMVEKVVRISSNPTQIRNICTCAHIDHGKTTFSDNLLSGAGMMSEELAGKQLALDFHEDEKARGITIDTAAVSIKDPEWDSYRPSECTPRSGGAPSASTHLSSSS